MPAPKGADALALDWGGTDDMLDTARRRPTSLPLASRYFGTTIVGITAKASLEIIVCSINANEAGA